MNLSMLQNNQFHQISQKLLLPPLCSLKLFALLLDRKSSLDVERRSLESENFERESLFAIGVLILGQITVSICLCPFHK